MRSAGTLKKFLIENRVDKEGSPDPRLIVTLDFRFTEEKCAALAHCTGGSQVMVDIEELQPELFKDRGSPLDDPKSGVHGSAGIAVDPDQRLLPWDGEIHPDAEEAEIEPVDPDQDQDDDDGDRIDDAEPLDPEDDGQPL